MDITPEQAAAELARRQQPTSFAEEAGKAATAASQGLIQGVGNLQDQAVLLFRDVTDGMGLTDPEYSKKIRQDMDVSNEVTKRAGEKLGYSGLSKVGAIAGEYAPQIAGGMGIFKGAKGLLGASRAADVAANAISGAGVSLLSDTGGGEGALAARAQNAVIGGGIGGAIGGVANLAGAGLGIVKNPSKAEAFRQMGLKPTASQVVDDINPIMKDRLTGIEMTLNKIPGIGIKGRVAKQTRQVRSYLENTVRELDEGLPDPKIKFENIKASLATSGIQDTSNVVKTAKINFDALSNAKGIKISKDTLGLLDDVAKKPPQTFDELHQFRMNLDDQIGTMKKSLGSPNTDSEFRALAKLRHSVSDSLDDIASKNGQGAVWKQANKEYQDQLYKSYFKEAFDSGFENKAGEFIQEGAKFNIKKFASTWNEGRKHLKEMRLEPPAEYKKAIDAIGTVVNTLAASPIKPGNPGIASALGQLALPGVGAGAIGYLSPTDAGTEVAGGAALLLGLGVLVKTKTGINMLASMGNKSLKTPTARAVLTSALALGQASKAKKTQEDDINFVNSITPEAAQAELARRGAQ